MTTLKIYFNDFPLIITDQKPSADSFSPGVMIIKDPDTAIAGIKENRSGYDRAVLFATEPEKARDAVFKTYKATHAAGGLVTNERQEILLIFRKQHWDMPKGHWEPGETIEECAVREVKEETGLNLIQLIKPLKITYHTYFRKSKNILKVNHWFLMKTKGNEPLSPQTDEGIETALWVKKDDLKSYYDEMFPSIKDVIGDYTNG